MLTDVCIANLVTRQSIAIYYVCLHNEYLLTTRDQGFNYGVNFAVKQSRASRKFIKSSLSVTPFFHAQGALEQAASTCGITALIMRWGKRLATAQIYHQQKSIRYDVSQLGVPRLITALIIRSLTRGYKNLLLAEAHYAIFLIRRTARNYVLNGRVNYTKRTVTDTANIYCSLTSISHNFSRCDVRINRCRCRYRH